MKGGQVGRYSWRTGEGTVRVVAVQNLCGEAYPRSLLQMKGFGTRLWTLKPNGHPSGYSWKKKEVGGRGVSHISSAVYQKKLLSLHATLEMSLLL